MTKKEFIEGTSYHKYGRGQNAIVALFFDWKVGGNFRGFKYCVYARIENAKKKDLINTLYDLVTERIAETNYYVSTTIAQVDSQRFRVPVSSGGLYGLIKLKKLKPF